MVHRQSVLILDCYKCRHIALIALVCQKSPSSQSIFIRAVLRTGQCRPGLHQLTFKVHTLLNFLCQNLINLCQLLGDIDDFNFQLVGPLQRIGYITDLQTVWNFLFEHGIDHNQLCPRPLDRVARGFIAVKGLSQRAGTGGRLWL